MSNNTRSHAVVFAATGAIAGSVATTLAASGMHVHLSALDVARLSSLADEIRAQGGAVSVAEVDATNDAAVEAYVDALIADVGTISVVFNGIGGRPASLRYPALSAGLATSDFLHPVARIVGSQFLTSRTVGRHMAENGGGAIVLLSATLSGGRFANMAGITAACGAVEAMTGALAGDFGPSGVRVNCVRANAMPETRTIQETFAAQIAMGGAPAQIPQPLLRRPLRVAETASLVAFLSSDAASGIAGQIMTATTG